MYKKVIYNIIIELQKKPKKSMATGIAQKSLHSFISIAVH